MTMATVDTIPADLRQLLQQTGLFTDVQISEILTNQQTAAQPLIISLVKSRAATEEKLLQALATALHLPFTRITDKEIDAAPREEVTKDDLEGGDQEASVVKFVNQIIGEAYKERATDIHMEPMENDLRIRYRVDGALHQTPVPAYLKRFQAAIISRIKVMANMDI